jgi:hypothetical protein
MRTRDIENYSGGKQFGDSLGIRPLVCVRTVVQLFSGGRQGLQWNANQCAVGGQAIMDHKAGHGSGWRVGLELAETFIINNLYIYTGVGIAPAPLF